MSLEDFIITVYCCVVENINQILNDQQLRRRGYQPKLTDAEVITMEIVGEFLGMDTDKAIWHYFKSHWQNWFPSLGSRCNFVRQAANLWQVKQAIQSSIAKQLHAEEDCLHLADGFPLPVCHFKRAHFSRIFKGIAAYGYCASKAETYYGFKGNVLINSEGVVADITVTPANIDERISLWEIVKGIKGLLFADKGLIGADFQNQLRTELGVNLQTPFRDNMNDPRGKDASSWLVSTRRLVETVIGQLTEQFNIQKVRARDLWHFTNRIARKILSHTVAVFINKAIGNEPLQFEKLVTL